MAFGVAWCYNHCTKGGWKIVAKIEHQRFYSGVGEIIRHLRKESGLSKTKVAGAMGVSLSKYISMEEGLEEPSLYDLYYFSVATGVAFDMLLGRIAEHINNASDE